MQFSFQDLRIGRILHQDDDFATIEVAKNDQVTFHLRQDENGETVGGDEFLTFLFVRHTEGNQAEIWDPFAA